MIKTLFLLTISLMPVAAFASGFNGNNLIPALNESFDLYNDDKTTEDLIAWQTKLNGESVEVKLLNKDAIVDSYNCVTGCSFTSSAPSSSIARVSADFDLMEDAQTSALRKLEKSLKRKGENLGSMLLVKTWLATDTTDGHGDGNDVWTKIVHTLGTKTMNIFVLCHKHGRDMACHYSRSGENEPSL